MKLPIADALASKKFLAFLVTIIVVVGNKVASHFGYEIDSSQVALLVGAGAAYILGQGIADHGKTAADTNAAVAAAIAMEPSASKDVALKALANVPASVSSTRLSQAGFAKLGLLLAIACMGSCVWGVGCAWFTSERKAVASDVVDCTKAEASKAITEFGPAIDALLLYATGGGGQLDTAQLGAAAKNFGKEIGGCVVADAVARALKPVPLNPDAPKSSPLVADPSSLHAAVARLYPGAKFHTANGDL